MEGLGLAPRWALGSALALLLVGGCAYQRGGLVRQSDRVLQSQTQARREASPHVEVRQEGTRIHVLAQEACRPHRVELVETTYSFGRTSAAPTQMTLTALASAAAITVGSLMAANVFDFPAEARVSRAYEGLTQEQGMGVGVALIGAGSIGAVVSLVHAFGLLGTDDEQSQRSIDRGPIAEAAPCSPASPVIGASVRLRAGAESQQLGTTGPGGGLSVDASQVLEPEFVLRHAGGQAEVEVAGQPAGEAIAMEPLEGQVEERFWSRAQATRCAAAEVPVDCVGVEGYLRRFPRGTHAEEARTILEGARARLAERARRIEEERRAEEERRRAEEERRLAAEEAWRAEVERERRAREAEWEREQRARALERAERERAAMQEAERRRARAQCERACRSSCAGNAQCESSCRAQQCR